MSKVSIKGVFAGCSASVLLALSLSLPAYLLFMQSHGLQGGADEVKLHEIKQSAAMDIVAYALMAASIAFGGYISAFVARRSEVLNGSLVAVTLLLSFSVAMGDRIIYNQSSLNGIVIAILCASLGGYTRFMMKGGQK